MVAFDKDMAHFNYRVAGVAIHNGRILLDRNTRNNYWVLPGGHPEMMEPMADALKREVREEIKADVEVVRLLWVLENFFHRGKDIHELSFYFLMEIDPGSFLLKGDGPFFGEEHDHALIFQWHPLDEAHLLSLPFYPRYLARELMNIPQAPVHGVYKELHRPQGSNKTEEVKKNTGAKVDNFLTIP